VPDAAANRARVGASVNYSEHDVGLGVSTPGRASDTQYKMMLFRGLILAGRRCRCGFEIPPHSRKSRPVVQVDGSLRMNEPRQQGLSQRAIANETGVDVSTVSRTLSCPGVADATPGQEAGSLASPCGLVLGP